MTRQEQNLFHLVHGYINEHQKQEKVFIPPEIINECYKWLLYQDKFIVRYSALANIIRCINQKRSVIIYPPRSDPFVFNKTVYKHPSLSFQNQVDPTAYLHSKSAVFKWKLVILTCSPITIQVRLMEQFRQKVRFPIENHQTKIIGSVQEREVIILLELKTINDELQKTFMQTASLSIRTQTMDGKIGDKTEFSYKQEGQQIIYEAKEIKDNSTGIIWEICFFFSIQRNCTELNEIHLIEHEQTFK